MQISRKIQRVIRRRRVSVSLSVSGILLLAFLPLAAATVMAQTQTNLYPYVQHVIIVIQENRTPDNLFNQWSGPGAHVQPHPPGQPLNSGLCYQNGQDSDVALWSTPLFTCWDPGHGHGKTKNPNSTPDWTNMWRNGNMDGACQISVGWMNRRYHQESNCQPSQTPPTCVKSKGPPWNQTCSYTYVDNSTGILQPYFNIASQYGFANYMFATNQGPSFPAHHFLFSGTSAPDRYNSDQCPPNGGIPCYKWFEAENATVNHGDRFGCNTVIDAKNNYAYDIDPNSDTESLAYDSAYLGYPCYTHNSLPTLLDAAEITWHYYLREGYSRQNGYTLWNAPAAMDDICHQNIGKEYGTACDTTDYTNNVQYFLPGGPNYLGDYAPILTDIENCNLAAVNWVIPDGEWSDHAGGKYTEKDDGGPSWVAAIVNGVGQSSCYDTINGKQVPYWNDTVILITWDDWGGYYDDVAPPDCVVLNKPCTGYSNGTGGQYVYGFRVPLLVAGAYAKQGYISGPNAGSSPNCTPPSYCHDFGSILNFIEYAFGTGGYPLGIAPGQYGISQDPIWPYADYFAMDYSPHVQYSYSLADFFNFSPSGFNSFQLIQGAKYPPECFHVPHPKGGGCFTGSDYPLDPDNDANEPD